MVYIPRSAATASTICATWNNTGFRTVIVANTPNGSSMAENVREELVALLPRLRRFAYSLSGSLDEADDLVQAACERALTRLHQYRPGTRLDSWMFRIIQTIWIDRRRSAARRDIVNDPEALEMVAHEARIAETTEARLALEIVRRETDRL